MSERGQRGKYAEKQVQTWLERESASRSNFTFHRFPDARAARGALAAQPADYLVSYYAQRVVPSMLEVKETQGINRLPKDKISQYGKLKAFWLAGFGVYVVVHKSVVGDWTYFDAADLFDHDEVPTSFPFHAQRSFQSATHVLDHLYT